MEMTWAIRLRIALAAAVGILAIGIYGWPMAAPADRFGVVSIVNGEIATSDLFIIGALAFVSGFIGYFLSWPYGTRIGILAAPAGLVVWSVRCADMGTLMQLNDTIARREQFYSTFCWEPLIWLAITAAGCLGVLFGYSICRPARKKPDRPAKSGAHKRSAIAYLTPLAAVIGSAVVAMFLIGMLARDFVILDPKVGYAIGQPALAQNIFAILVSFGVAGYLVKKVFDLEYYWPIIATALVIPFGIISFGQYEVLEYFAQRWPAVFFANSVLTIFPIQAVSFGTLGAIAGYWIGVRYDHWREYES
jgi:hypothetical protein